MCGPTQVRKSRHGGESGMPCLSVAPTCQQIQFPTQSKDGKDAPEDKALQHPFYCAGAWQKAYEVYCTMSHPFVVSAVQIYLLASTLR